MYSEKEGLALLTTDGWTTRLVTRENPIEKGDFTMRIEKRMKELGIPLPELSNTGNQFIPARTIGNLIFTSGSTALVDGKLLLAGRVGKEVTMEQAEEAARICLVNCLAKAKAELGDLDRIVKVIKINGFVASAEGFRNQSGVMNAASELAIDLFGEAGKHARTALGVAELPGGSPVEVEIIAEYR